MDWDKLMDLLNTQQRYLQGMLDACKKSMLEYRPGTDVDEIVQARPSILFNLVQNNQAHWGVIPAAIVLNQIEFNRALITMLTDLDYRKLEPSQNP